MTTVEKQKRQSKWRDLVNDDVIPKLVDYKRRGIVPTLRTIFYYLYSLHKVPNTSNSYEKIMDFILEARKEGRISWEAIADETRRSVAGFYDRYISPEGYIRNLVWGDLQTIHERYVPKVLYKWYRQPKYVEVWLEKNAMLSTFRNLLADRHVRIVPNRGYSSWGYAYENFKRLASMAREPYFEEINGQPVRKYLEKDVYILYFGDYDPSGSDMDRFLSGPVFEYFTKYFELEGRVHFEPRVAITKEQIEEFGLPHAPDRKKDPKTIEKTERDPRYDKWLEAHDDELFAVELDALPAYDADAFQRILQGAVDQHYDPRIWDEVVQNPEHSTEAIRLLEVAIAKEWLYDRGYNVTKRQDTSS